MAFRIGFGLMMAWWAWDYLSSGRVRYLCIEPRFHFTYYGLDWIRPWPGIGMYLQFALMLVAALCIACGLLYRWSCLLFAFGFTHFFLLDRTNYQNHYYLIALLSWTMLLVPAHRYCSIDAVNHLVAPRPYVPAWSLWLVRFHIALPYFFGGVAKFDADWFAGEPMRQVLRSHSWVPFVGDWLATEAAVQVFTWGGLLFDLAIVPLLLWRRTTAPAYCVAIAFHLTNAFLFNIHIFPWLMICATTIFFTPDWPRKVLGLQRMQPAHPLAVQCPPWSARQRLAAALMIGYCGFHLIWPLRHHCYRGNAAWTEQGHYFAWRMMLRGKTTGLRYYVTDAVTGTTHIPDIRLFINDEQSGKFARDPEMILHLAHFLRDDYCRQTGRDAQVHALVLTSLNGRIPQLLIDPNVDLANEPRGFHSRPWIMPMTEPLPEQPWTAPLSEWERLVPLPDLTFLTR